LHSQGFQEEVTPRPRRQIRWRVVFLRLAAVLILFAAVGALVYVSAAGDFFVYEHNTEIQGNHYIDRATIFQTAGVNEGNIFWIEPDGVEERLRQLDGVKTVSVQCALPARVAIRIEERKPVLRWHSQVQNRDWWLDEEGLVLPYAAVVTGTVSVVDFSGQQLKAGDRVAPVGIVQSVQHLAKSLPAVQEIHYQADRGLSYTQKAVGGEWPVYIGDNDDLPQKIQVLQALMQYLTKNHIQPRYVDVRWAKYPVYGKSTDLTTSGGD
jgi:cell division septal protein FtsQ